MIYLNTEQPTDHFTETVYNSFTTSACYSLISSVLRRILIHTTRRRAFLMKHRNESTKKDLARAIINSQENEVKDIKIFCIGNELYGNPPHRLAENYRDLSGVRELRSYCRSVPAEARMNSALVFVKDQVPALLDSIHQWTLAGHDSVSPARASELRSALEQAERSLRQVGLIFLLLN